MCVGPGVLLQGVLLLCGISIERLRAPHITLLQALGVLLSLSFTATIRDCDRQAAAVLHDDDSGAEELAVAATPVAQLLAELGPALVKVAPRSREMYASSSPKWPDPPNIGESSPGVRPTFAEEGSEWAELGGRRPTLARLWPTPGTMARRSQTLRVRIMWSAAARIGCVRDWGGAWRAHERTKEGG